MKKIFTLLGCSFFAFQMQAQSIPNGDFEGSWRNVNIIPIVQVSEVPDGWVCSDSLVGVIAPLALGFGYTIVPEKQCFKETNAHGGSFAVGIKTITVMDSVILPAMFTNGTMEFDISQLSGGDLSQALKISGGTPALDKQVDTVKAFVYLDTANRYSAVVNITAVKMINGVKEIIGQGAAIINQDTVYQEINVAMQYSNPLITKTDTLLISFVSAVPAANDTLEEDGNYLVIDDVSATFSEGQFDVSVNKINSAKNIQVFPNPNSTGVLNFQMKDGSVNAMNVLIMDLNGRTLIHKTLNGKEASIDVSSYSNGIYFYHIFNDKRKFVEGGKFVISQ